MTDDEKWSVLHLGDGGVALGGSNIVTGDKAMMIGLYHSHAYTLGPTTVVVDTAVLELVPQKVTLDIGSVVVGVPTVSLDLTAQTCSIVASALTLDVKTAILELVSRAGEILGIGGVPHVSIEQRINEHLRSSTSVTSLVGVTIRPVAMDQDAAPGLAYKRTSFERDHNMGTDSPTITSRFEITIWAKDIDTSRQIGSAVRQSMDWWTGRGSTSAPEVLDTMFEGQSFAFDGDYHEITQDYVMVHTT